MDRKKFLQTASLATASVTILNFPVFGKKAPSNKVQLAIMGLNGRGSYLAHSFSRFENVEIAYICDIEDHAIAKGFAAVKDARRKPELLRDIRKLLEKRDFDGLVVAAPDHWHAPAAILAAAHGKHVYVEKPCGHNPYEGELIATAMKKSGKMIQMGNQRRSMPTLIMAAKMIRDGALGNVYFAKAWYANNRKSIGIGKKVPVPSGLDFDLWQGPAPRREYQDNLVPYNWHWFWHWGTGEACNNGTHEIDCCRWFLDVDFPTRVTSSGGRYAFKDDWQTPDTQVASFEFGAKGTITWESRSCQNFPVEGSDRGFVIFGTNGTLINRGGGDYEIRDLKNKVVKQQKSEVAVNSSNTLSANGDLDLYHLHNFVNTIQERETLNSPVTEAYKTVLLCHLANIAQRTSGALDCDPSNGHILGNAAASALWQRSYEPGWGPVV